MTGWTSVAPSWQMAPMASPRRPFVGRDRELEELVSGLEEAAGGRGGLFLVVGPAGMGKTRLCDEVARAAEGRGLRPLWGRCWETGGAPAYWPWMQILRELLRAPDGAALREALGAETAPLGQLLPELFPANADGGADSDPAATRFRLFQAVVAVLRAAGERTPLLLVLDDLHAADPTSLALLHFVARNVRGVRALVLGAYRDEDARLSELGPALTDIAREGTYLPLTALGRAEIAALVGAAGVQASIDAVERASEGNPLFLVELLRLLVQRGELARGDAPLPIPDTVKEVISRRIARLAPATRAALEAASIVGRDFSLPLVCSIAGAAVEAQLAEAEHAGLVVATGAEGWRFSHVLVRESLYRALPPRQRAEGHAKLADALEAAHGERALAEIAHHRLAALPAGDAGRAAEAARRAGERAMAMLAFEDAAQLFEQAREALARAAGDRRALCELALRAGLAHLRGGAIERGRAACTAAADEARRLKDGALLARAALTYGAELMLAHTDPQLTRSLEEALAALPPEPSGLRAQCLARLAAALQPSRTPEQPMAMAREAVAMARATGEREVLAAVLSHAGSALADYANPTERAAVSEELARLAQAAGDRVLELRAQSRLVFDESERGDLRRGLRALDSYERLAHELRQPRHLWPARLMRSMLALASGRFEEADRSLAEARELARSDRELITPVVFASHQVGRFLLTERPADFDRAEAALHAISLPGELGLVVAEASSVCMAGMSGWRGDLEGARQHMAGIDLDGHFLTNDGNAIALFAETVARLADGRLAGILYERLAPYPDRLLSFGRTGMVLMGSTDRFLGMLSAVQKRHDLAVQHFEAALALERKTQSDLLSVRTKLWYARTLLDRGRSGDEAGAAELVAEALPVAERLDLRYTREQLCALRGTHRPPPPSPRVSAGAAFSLVREGEYWTVSADGAVLRLKDSRGLSMLARLIAHPGEEFHVLALMGSSGEVDGGDAGEVLDHEAIEDYRARVRELDEELTEAEGWSDAGRAARAREEREALVRELARGVGLGGRERRAGGAAERARTNVQRRVRGAIRKIAEAMPALGAYLERAVRTGTFCSYDPF
jgi:hypothetical protein